MPTGALKRLTGSVNVEPTNVPATIACMNAPSLSRPHRLFHLRQGLRLSDRPAKTRCVHTCNRRRYVCGFDVAFSNKRSSCLVTRRTSAMNWSAMTKVKDARDGFYRRNIIVHLQVGVTAVELVYESLTFQLDPSVLSSRFSRVSSSRESLADSQETMNANTPRSKI
jgi:hypothetical protein